MATTTTNFGWDIPQSTDLVKDGATAIAALGQDIDTAFVDLKGGTTGQVLAKASGTDLDFSWVAQDDSNAIQNAIVDAKGDLIAATAADTPARLAVGTNGYVLTADSAEATGLKWAAAASGYTPELTLLNAGGTSLSGSTTTISSISGKQWLYIYFTGASTTTNSKISVRLNGDSGGNYLFGGLAIENGGGAFEYNETAGTAFDMGITVNSSGTVLGYLSVFNCNTTTPKPVYGFGKAAGTSARNFCIDGGHYAGTSAITSVSLITSSGTFDAGTVYVYGA